MSIWPSLWSKKLGTPNDPAIRFTRGTDFVATMVRNCYGLSGCSPPWTDLTVKHFGHRGLLLPGFRRVRVALAVAGYNYNSDWTPCMGLFLSRSFSKKFQQSGLSFFLRQFLCLI